MKLKFASFNCCSLKKNIDLIRKLTSDEIDLVFLQETFITDNDLSLLDFIDENYHSLGIGAVYSQKSIESCAGRAMGGMACLYRSNAVFNVKLIDSSNDVMLVMVTVNGKNYLFINAYIRSDLGDIESLNNYLNTLNFIEDKLNNVNFNAVYLCGDFNADVGGGRAWDSLVEFVARNNLMMFDVDLLPQDSFTYTSYSTSHCKWLDHIIGKSFHSLSVLNIKILTDLIGSDHFPVVVTLDIPVEVSDETASNFDQSYFVDWNSLKTEDIKSISLDAFAYMGDFDLSGSLKCNTVGCNDIKCLSEISDLYDRLVRSVDIASLKFSKKIISRDKFKIIPGWNRDVKSFYIEARDKFKFWISCGRPRDGIHFDEMKSSRSEFKKKLNICKNNETEERLLSLEQKFEGKDMKFFWREVNNKRGKSFKTSNIDGFSDPKKITNIFLNKFLSTDDDDDESGNVDNDINQQIFDCIGGGSYFNVCISKESLIRLIEKLNLGVGHDSLHSLFLSHSCDGFLNN